MHRVLPLVLLIPLAACSESGDATTERAIPPVEPAPVEPAAPEARTTAPGFDLPPPPRATLRHAQAHAARAQALYTSEAAPEDVVAHYTQAIGRRGLRVEPRLDARTREPHLFREVILGWGDDERMAAARATVERGPSGLTRVSLDQRRPYGPDFDSGPEPRAWRVIARPPLPAPPGEGVPACTRAIQRACDAWARASEEDALSCAMEHRGPCILTEARIDLGRSVLDARQRLLAALHVHDSVATDGARRETEAQLRLELVAADAVLHRAMGRLDEAGSAELEALAELIRATALAHEDGVRPGEWFAPAPGAE